MADINPIQNAFNAGELSPRMKGRTDLEKYASAAETIENFVIQPEGGLLRRSGSRFVQALSDETKKSRMVTFKFSTADAYAVEFSENLIRFYTNEAYVSGADVVSTYLESELFDLRFTQSGDFLYIAHKSHHPAILKRTAPTTFTLTNVPFEAGPMGENNRDTDLGVAHSAISGTVTLTAQSPGIFTAFDDDGEGRMFGQSQSLDATPGARWGWGKITVFTSVTVATLVVEEALSGADGAPLADWVLGAFSPDPDIGFPSAVGFFESRLCWAGTTPQPDTFWGSETGIFDSYLEKALIDKTVIDSHAVNYTLASGELNRIDWMFPLRSMILGAAGSISSIEGGGGNVGLTPTSVQINRITSIGAKAIEPVLVGTTLCYITRFGSEMVGLQFSFSEAGFTPSLLTLLADHVLKSPVTQLAYAQSPSSLIYAVRTDGELASLTLIPDQQVFGWSRQILGGSFGTGIAVVESAATIPSPNQDHDQTWLIVKRTINGATRRYVEFFEDDFDDDTDITDAYFVDCGITYDAAPATVITGLSHLEGETLQVLADGSVVPDAVVSGGQITLATAASTVQVGLGYNSDLKSLNLEANLGTGTLQGKKARIVRMTTRFHNTVGGNIGRDASNLDPMPGRPDGLGMGAPVQPVSKDVHTPFSGTYDDTPVIFVRQDQPLPMTILSAMPETAVGARS